MKTNKMILSSLFFGLLLALCVDLYAQDPVKVAPNNYKVLLDNDQVRVIQIEIAPGEIATWHSHPNYVSYALTDGKMEITEKGKAPVVRELKANNAIYEAAVTHMSKNVGTTTMKMILTELKSPQTKDMKATTNKPEKK
jgi:quercetin dioxygenase-like cupin family protein